LGQLLTLAAVAALVASLMPLAGRLGWILELASHFRVQYVVVDALLAVALATQRRYAWAAALAACAALSAAPVVPYLPTALTAGADAATRPTIKVLVANVFYRNDSAQGLLESIRRESPDAVLIVEYTPQWSTRLAELRAAYPHRIESPSGDPYGIALFSRLEFAAAETFMLDETVAVDARLRVRGEDLTLLGVHLRSPTNPHRAAVRNRQLELLAERVTAARDAVVVAGDFNISPYSPYYADWLAATGLTDTRRGRTPAPSWPTFLPILGIPIDHCFVSPDIEVVAHRGLPAFGSDHYPVLVELALPPAGASEYKSGIAR
jgi:endonuclease/exonuclease/phosphatase (EEP) superfamily protein YafD